MSTRSIFATIAALGALFFASQAGAQNISSVPSADVEAGDFSAEYRAGFAAEDDGREEGFAQRFHVQYAFNDKWRLRTIVFQGKRGAEALQTTAVRIESLYQFVESEASGGWDSAIRIEGQIPVNGGPGRTRVGWFNTLKAGENWNLRGHVILGREFGDNRDDGFSIETRTQATRDIGSDLRFGAQMFSIYETANFGGFNDQRHQAGPILKGDLSDRIDFELSLLFGLSRAASDTDLRLFVGYSF